MKTEHIDDISERHDLSVIVLEPRAVLDAAFVAVTFDDTQKPVAVYSRRKTAMLYAEHEKVTYRDALEWFDFNADGMVVWLEDLANQDDDEEVVRLEDLTSSDD